MDNLIGSSVSHTDSLERLLTRCGGILLMYMMPAARHEEPRQALDSPVLQLSLS